MVKVRGKELKSLVLTLDQGLYNTILERAKIEDITVLAEIRNLLKTGINVETKNNDISYLVKKINGYDYQLAKISSMLKLNYDLAVQDFCNKGYTSNRNSNKDPVYQEFLNSRKRDNIND